MPRPTARPRPAHLTARVALLVLAALLAGPGRPASPLFAQNEARKPAKKDSSPRTKPKQVTVTAAVSPVEAKPGETVTYTVTAKLESGWHVYKYAAKQEGEGPRNTRFDLFDTAGLTVDGDWTPSRAPLRKKEPAFPDLDAVEFYEDEVSWSITLKVPADSPPGKKSLRAQASYQICDAKSCSFPGQWTLPDAELNVLASGDQAAATPKPATPPAPVATSATVTGPAKADTPAGIKPKSATLSAAVKPAEARPGETVRLEVTAKLAPGYHIYQFARAQPAQGPRATQFDLFDAAGLKRVDDVWTSTPAPAVKEEPAFDNMLVESFEGEVTWSTSLQVPPDAAPGVKTLRLQAAYQVCDATKCLPFGRWTLPDVALTVLPGGAAAVAPAAVPPAPEAKADTAVASAPKRVVSDVERTARQGLLPLMLAAAVSGLIALAMPCIWPMVPITVNFFVKQGQGPQGARKTTGLAITYCLAIIGVFTGLGVLCSFFLSATALSRLANNPWLNLGVAALFLAFGLSLLGLFEIRLPNALLNASAQGESRGGLVGVMFMALTLTITSFTCTFPVVGGLLLMVAGGEFLAPVVGLATFATVLALPFFLLALAPGLLAKLPRSGDWMNSVKVVGGLIEVGAAFKFLNTAELAYVTPANAWVDAQFVLTTWVVLAAVCGFYLLGFFRTDHDHGEGKVGPGRILVGSAFLVSALFLAPALFGRPPQSPIWDRLVIGILPPDASELTAEGPLLAGKGAGGGAPGPREVHATDADPSKAERQETRFHGVTWGMSLEQALERAKAESKPVLIDFTGVNCANCRLMEARVLPLPEVAKLMGSFVTLQLYTDFVPIDSITGDQREALAQKNLDRLIEMTNDNSNPYYVILTPEGQVIGARGGYCEPDVFVNFLTQGLTKANAARPNVAQADKGR